MDTPCASCDRDLIYPPCAGFGVHPNRPNVCRHCFHARGDHKEATPPLLEHAGIGGNAAPSSDAVSAVEEFASSKTEEEDAASPSTSAVGTSVEPSGSEADASATVHLSGERGTVALKQRSEKRGPTSRVAQLAVPTERRMSAPRWVKELNGNISVEDDEDDEGEEEDEEEEEEEEDVGKETTPTTECESTSVAEPLQGTGELNKDTCGSAVATTMTTCSPPDVACGDDDDDDDNDDEHEHAAPQQYNLPPPKPGCVQLQLGLTPNHQRWCEGSLAVVGRWLDCVQHVSDGAAADDEDSPASASPLPSTPVSSPTRCLLGLLQLYPSPEDVGETGFCAKATRATGPLQQDECVWVRCHSGEEMAQWITNLAQAQAAIVQEMQIAMEAWIDSDATSTTPTTLLPTAAVTSDQGSPRSAGVAPDSDATPDPAAVVPSLADEEELIKLLTRVGREKTSAVRSVKTDGAKVQLVTHGGVVNHVKSEHPLVRRDTSDIVEQPIIRPVEEERVLVVDDATYTPYYQHYFHGKEHKLFYGRDSHKDPVFVAVEARKEADPEMGDITLRALVISARAIDAMDTRWAFLPSDCASIRKELSTVLPQLPGAKWKEVSDGIVKEDLCQLERTLLTNVKKYKFGVLYVKPDQVDDENAFFANDEDDVSDAFRSFVSLLGDRVALRGWDKYSGGLNTKEDLHGTHSRYATVRDIEIMFHLAPFMPRRAEDEQSVDRKRHIGNDVVCIIFSDSKDILFDPLVVRSQFIHVVPERVCEDGRVFYRVAVVSKPGVQDIAPRLCVPPVFEGNIHFRDWLLAKCINAERASMKAKAFVQKLYRTKVAYLRSISDGMSKRKPSGGIFSRSSGVASTPTSSPASTKRHRRLRSSEGWHSRLRKSVASAEEVQALEKGQVVRRSVRVHVPTLPDLPQGRVVATETQLKREKLLRTISLASLSRSSVKKGKGRRFRFRRSKDDSHVEEH